MTASRCLPASLDLAQRLAAAPRREPLGEQVGQAQDGVHRRADLVAHVGQERALGAAGRLGRVPGQGQLGGAARHELLQVVAVAVQLLRQALLLGDVLLDREIVRHPPVGLPDGRELHELQVLAAVLALVVELALPGPALHQGRPHGVVGRAGGAPGLEDARVPAQHLRARVAGRAQEGRVHILDLRVQVGDDDAFRTLLHRQGELGQLVAGDLPLRDVLGADEDATDGAVARMPGPHLPAQPPDAAVLPLEAVLVRTDHLSRQGVAVRIRPMLGQLQEHFVSGPSADIRLAEAVVT